MVPEPPTDPPGAPLRDRLALDRTELAIERTGLAVLRTALGLVAAGATVAQLGTFPGALPVAAILGTSGLVVLTAGGARTARRARALARDRKALEGPPS